MTLDRRTILAGAALAAVPALANASQIKDLRRAVEKAIQGAGVLRLEAGDYPASAIRIDAAVVIEGVPGRTRIIAAGGEPGFIIEGADGVRLSGLAFSAGDGPPTDGFALVTAADASLAIDNCSFTDSPGGGLRLERCAGRVSSCDFSRIAQSALFARDSRGLEIAGNTVSGIGNNGIQVWRSEPGEDGTIVTGNRISKISANDGGTGQNGNGINIYRAGNVMVSGNRISDCAFTAVRNNGGSNCQIVANSISRMGEVAIYCEFGFEGAVVSGNLIDDVALGISITNFNEGGRLASVANNVIRNVTGGGTLAYTRGVGIGAEADTVVTGNVIEDAAHVGISLGWGKYSRGLSATGNVVRNCAMGIAFSVSAGADWVLIASNRISGATMGSIIGADHGEPRTDDLGLPGAAATLGIIANNLVKE